MSNAVAGTAIGAVAGAAIGGRDGAAVGAGTGLLFGTLLGNQSGHQERMNAQSQYDHAYIQCMFSAGHRIPVPADSYGISSSHHIAPSVTPMPISAPSSMPPPPLPPAPQQ